VRHQLVRDDDSGIDPQDLVILSPTTMDVVELISSYEGGKSIGPALITSSYGGGLLIESLTLKLMVFRSFSCLLTALF